MLDILSLCLDFNVSGQNVHNLISSASDDETCGASNNGKTAIGMQPDLIAL